MRSRSSPRGQHDHRGRSAAANLSEHLEAVETWHHDVEDDQIDPSAAKAL